MKEGKKHPKMVKTGGLGGLALNVVKVGNGA